jgi:hypothetical protein
VSVTRHAGWVAPFSLNGSTRTPPFYTWADADYQDASRGGAGTRRYRGRASAHAGRRRGRARRDLGRLDDAATRERASLQRLEELATAHAAESGQLRADTARKRDEQPPPQNAGRRLAVRHGVAIPAQGLWGPCAA